ncbi:MAG: hypothetical protein FWG26_06350 [Betaproteobacteria bacterium]|nr:hypothetical protein [Betaproteobacteria bacterium]
MKMQIKTWGKIAIALCVFVPTLLSSAYYAQTQGVCLKTGRALGEEELRKAVLANIVNHRIKQTFRYNHEFEQDAVLGINSPTQETNLQKLIEDSYNNNKSFEENFGLNKILLNGRKQKKYDALSPGQLSEPFLAIDFESRRNGDATIFISSNLKKIAFSDMEPELKEAAKEKMTWYNKLLGYGNHYFDFGFPFFYSIMRECCDNRDSNDKDYLQRKEEAYTLSLKAVTVDKTKHIDTNIGVVTNCGDLLLSKNGEIAILGNKYNDEDDD